MKGRTPMSHRHRRRLRLLAIGCPLLVALILVNGPPLIAFGQATYHNWKINTAAYKRQYGHWVNVNIPADHKINAVHAVLLSSGKVLVMAGSGNNIGNFNAGRFESELYDPVNNTFKKLKTPYDMFCSGHFILPDGNVLIAGGTARYEVLASQVRYAAGVMSIANRSTTLSLNLPIGTTFQSPTGQLYRSTVAVTVLPARKTIQQVRGRAAQVTEPSYAPVWVKAEHRGGSPVSKTARVYSIVGLPESAAQNLQASAYSITRSEQNFWGTRKSYIFNVKTERYEKVSNLNVARWYPTLVGLKNGNVLAVSGLDQYGQIIAGRSEEFSPTTDRWTLQPRLTKGFPTYPALFLMPNGDLFFTGANTGYGPADKAWRTPGIWNPNTNTFQPLGAGLTAANQTETAGSALLAPAQAQKYAIVGGGGVGTSNLSTGRIEVIDLRSKHPVWKPDGRLPTGTRYPEVVLMPTDNVLISGGSKDYRGEHGSDLMTAHMWDPSNGMLMSMAGPLVGRDYHSEGVLLPDGRVLTLGGNPLYGNKQDTTPQVFRKQISIYSPPYLFHGARPSLTGGPSAVDRGDSYSFTTPDAASIAKVRLVHPSAVTHVTDVQQRSIAVSFTHEHGALRLTIPTGSGLVPSGYYMLFVDNNRGVPSVARWVHVA